MDLGVSPSLHHLFMPQVEQLLMPPTRRRCGVSATMSEQVGAGGFWAVGVGDDCLFTVLDVTLRAPVDMVTEAGGYACLGQMSSASATSTPVASEPLMEEGNLVTFHQPGGDLDYMLEGGVRYASRSLCLLPSFFAKMASTSPEEGALLAKVLGSPTANRLPRAVSRLLESVGPDMCDAPGTGFRVASMVSEVMAIVLEDAHADEEARRKEGSICARNLVRDAHALMLGHLNESLTLDRMAADLCVSRSSLAAIFKRETGSGVAEHLRRLRMEKAALLLSTTSMSAAEVGRAVGYPRASTFTAAFKANVGATPTAWRSQHSGG